MGNQSIFKINTAVEAAIVDLPEAWEEEVDWREEVVAVLRQRKVAENCLEAVPHPWAVSVVLLLPAVAVPRHRVAVSNAKKFQR